MSLFERVGFSGKVPDWARVAYPDHFQPMITIRLPNGTERTFCKSWFTQMSNLRVGGKVAFCPPSDKYQEENLRSSQIEVGQEYEIVKIEQP